MRSYFLEIADEVLQDAYRYLMDIEDAGRALLSISNLIETPKEDSPTLPSLRSCIPEGVAGTQTPYVTIAAEQSTTPPSPGISALTIPDYLDCSKKLKIIDKLESGGQETKPYLDRLNTYLGQHGPQLSDDRRAKSRAAMKEKFEEEKDDLYAWNAPPQTFNCWMANISCDLDALESRENYASASPSIPVILEYGIEPLGEKFVSLLDTERLSTWAHVIQDLLSMQNGSECRVTLPECLP